jgi:hypothetical protein
MAVFMTNSSADPERTGRDIVEYDIDAPTDIALLPLNDRIKEGSTAFCPDSSQLWQLMTAGWRLI